MRLQCTSAILAACAAIASPWRIPTIYPSCESHEWKPQLVAKSAPHANVRSVDEFKNIGSDTPNSNSVFLVLITPIAKETIAKYFIEEGIERRCCFLFIPDESHFGSFTVKLGEILFYDVHLIGDGLCFAVEAAAVHLSCKLRNFEVDIFNDLLPLTGVVGFGFSFVPHYVHSAPKEGHLVVHSSELVAENNVVGNEVSGENGEESGKKYFIKFPLLEAPFDEEVNIAEVIDHRIGIQNVIGKNVNWRTA